MIQLNNRRGIHPTRDRFHPNRLRPRLRSRPPRPRRGRGRAAVPGIVLGAGRADRLGRADTGRPGYTRQTCRGPPLSLERGRGERAQAVGGRRGCGEGRVASADEGEGDKGRSGGRGRVAEEAMPSVHIGGLGVATSDGPMVVLQERTASGRGVASGRWRIAGASNAGVRCICDLVTRNWAGGHNR